MTFGDVTGPEHVLKPSEMYEQARRSRAPATLEKQYVRRDGTRLWAQLTVAPVGESGGLVAMISDISERKRAEKRVRETMLHQDHMVSQLQALDRAKSEVVSTAAHELRTPLTSIMGYTELLASGEGGSLSGDQAMMVATVDRNAKRLLSLVEDLLSLTRIEAGDSRLELAPTDVASLARAVVDGIRPSATARGIELSLEVEGNLPLVWGDRTQLDRALLNLCSNAVKFTPRGGRVRMCVRSERTATGTWVVVRIDDTGIGIPEDEQEHIFERFFRSRLAQKAAIQGTGLGLAIVKTIVEQHRGRIEIRSETGAGTSVTIELPAGGT